MATRVPRRAVSSRTGCATDTRLRHLRSSSKRQSQASQKIDQQRIDFCHPLALDPVPRALEHVATSKISQQRWQLLQPRLRARETEHVVARARDEKRRLVRKIEESRKSKDVD